MRSHIFAIAAVAALCATSVNAAESSVKRQSLYQVESDNASAGRQLKLKSSKKKDVSKEGKSVKKKESSKEGKSSKAGKSVKKSKSETIDCPAFELFADENGKVFKESLERVCCHTFELFADENGKVFKESLERVCGYEPRELVYKSAKKSKGKKSSSTDCPFFDYLDVDNNGDVSKKEVVSKGLCLECPVFERIDSDKNGKLSREEFGEFGVGINFIFNALDKDDNEELSKEEFVPFWGINCFLDEL